MTRQKRLLFILIPSLVLFLGAFFFVRQKLAPEPFDDVTIIYPCNPGKHCDKFGNFYAVGDYVPVYDKEDIFSGRSPSSINPFRQVAIATSKKVDEFRPTYFLVNRFGRKIDDRTYEEMEQFVEGVSVVSNDGEYWYISSDGKDLYPERYKLATSFDASGHAEVYKKSDGPSAYILKKDGGHLNKEPYRNIQIEFASTLFSFGTKDDYKTYLIRADGSELNGIGYASVSVAPSFSVYDGSNDHGMMIAKKDDGRKYVLKKNGTELNGKGYDQVTIYTEDQINVRLGDRYFTLNRAGEEFPFHELFEVKK